MWNSQYPLKPFVDPKEFKSYAELKVKLVDALGGDLRSEAGEEDTFESDTKARSSSRRSVPKQETEDVDVDTYLKSLGNE